MRKRRNRIADDDYKATHEIIVTWILNLVEPVKIVSLGRLAKLAETSQTSQASQTTQNETNKSNLPI